MKPDFVVRNEGSVYLLQPRTDAAQAWADEFLPEDAMMFGSSIVIEHRYIQDIVSGIQQDGLKVA